MLLAFLEKVFPFSKMRPGSMGETFLKKPILSKRTVPERNLARFVGGGSTLMGTHPRPRSYLPTRSLRPDVQGRVGNVVLEISGNFSGSWEWRLSDGFYIYDKSKYDSRPKQDGGKHGGIKREGWSTT